MSNARNPWYKRGRVWLAALLGVAILGAISPVEETTPEPMATVEKPAAKPETPTPMPSAPKSEPIANSGMTKTAPATPKAEPVPAEPDRVVQLRALVEEYADEYAGSEIDKIVINENLGADDGSYIVLAHMAFPRKNGAKQSRVMIEMYSEDLAANLAKEADVSEVTAFWAVPRFVADGNAAKYNFQRKGGGMYLAGSHIDPALQVE